MLSPGGEYAGYGTGTRHLRRILDLLARIRPGVPRDVAIDRIDFRATAGTVVVVLSPMLSERMATPTVRLVRRGLPVIVVDPCPRTPRRRCRSETDPRVAALAWRMRLIERRHVLARLAAAGCPVVPWHGPRTLEEVLRRLARRAQLPRVGCPMRRRVPGGGWALRLVIFLGPIVALLAGSPQGYAPRAWWWWSSRSSRPPSR